MQRRAFIRDTGKTVIAISIFGNLKWNDNHYMGDNPTTTDILGPYYRPGAPLRININPPGFSGEVLHLKGTVFQEDGRTPVKNCLVEIWQCNANQQYDNTSDEYHYRGAQKTNNAGKYFFITTPPVPYPVEEGSSVYRPAHIHMRISGKGQQDLITQIYFKGDSYIEQDAAASAQAAMNRILNITRNNKKEKELLFDVVLAKESVPAEIIFKEISGVYRMNDKSLMEFYKEGDLLFIKWNGQIREALAYKGDNQFSGGVNNSTKAKFEIMPDQKVKVTIQYNAIALKKQFNLEGVKEFKY